MTIAETKPEHQVLYQDLCRLIGRHQDTLSGQEILAVAANMLGKLVAMQDQRVVSRELAMAIVERNFSIGNQQVVEQLMNSVGNA